MPDDLVGRLEEHLHRHWSETVAQARDRIITALTARLAALEQATPEVVVEMARKAANDLQCHLIYETEATYARAASMDEIALAVISAITPTLRAQGAAAERERCAKVCEEIAEAYELDNQSGDAAQECGGAIRAGECNDP